MSVQQKLATKLFGTGGSTGRCKECKQLDVLGTEGRCTSCCRELARFPALHCVECYGKLSRQYKKPWSPLKRGTFSCLNCGEEKQVDLHGLCKSCDEISSSGDGKECVNCHILFKPTEITDTHCGSCKPECYGCSKKFTPHNKTQIFCRTCLSSIEQGLCTTCFDYVGHADARGRCEKCTTGPEKRKYWCKVCEVRPVDAADGVCVQCQRRRVKCPFCPNKISATEFACIDCLTSKYGLT